MSEEKLCIKSIPATQCRKYRALWGVSRHVVAVNTALWELIEEFPSLGKRCVLKIERTYVQPDSIEKRNKNYFECQEPTHLHRVE